MWIGKGSPDIKIDIAETQKLLESAFYIKGGKCSKVLIIPPDITRLHSGAGEITQLLYQMLGKNDVFHIMTAIGTHEPLSKEQKELMYGDIPWELFKIHDWRNDVVEIGLVERDFVSDVSDDRLSMDIPIQVNKILLENDYDLIISVGQVVPHENTGFANYTKNILVGIGGQNTINRGHYLAGVYGMEDIMGRIDTPLRKVFDYAEEKYLKDIDILYVMTVRDRDESGELVTRGLYIGDERKPFEQAAKLSQRLNITRVKYPLKKVIAYLDPKEYQSHWLGNKSIYRSRMAIADDGELIVIAPGLREYGEDPEVDRLIRKYGYHGTEEILQEVNDNEDLRNNLVAAAHLIHGSTEGRFKVTYAPGHLSKEETENVGYQWADVNQLMEKYNPEKLKDGMNDDFYYISNPALGLWTAQELEE
ncbi:DUF2088 domain-containing protein [Candidatus Poribacteria bacterium]|nr:DUF2088 domain-containing protein [Candidatus Poribacteria bacterium]